MATCVDGCAGMVPTVLKGLELCSHHIFHNISTCVAIEDYTNLRGSMEYLPVHDVDRDLLCGLCGRHASFFGRQHGFCSICGSKKCRQCKHVLRARICTPMLFSVSWFKQ